MPNQKFTSAQHPRARYPALSKFAQECLSRTCKTGSCLTDLMPMEHKNGQSLDVRSIKTGHTSLHPDCNAAVPAGRAHVSVAVYVCAHLHIGFPLHVLHYTNLSSCPMLAHWVPLSTWYGHSDHTAWGNKLWFTWHRSNLWYAKDNGITATTTVRPGSTVAHRRHGMRTFA